MAQQDSLSVGFSRQEFLSGVPFPPPGDLPDPGVEPMSLMSPALQADSLLLSHHRSQIKQRLEIFRGKNDERKAFFQVSI